MSTTYVPGEARYEIGGPLHDIRLTQGGLLVGIRNRGAVNLIGKAGMVASWIHGDGQNERRNVRFTPRVEFGLGVAERFELTVGIDRDHIGLHTGWRF